MHEEIQEEINNSIIVADEHFKNEEFEDALHIYETILKKAEEIGWNERVLNIKEMITQVQDKIEEQEKSKEELRKKEEEERKKREKQKRLEAARERLRKKEQMKKEQKLKELQQKKKKENEMQKKAYDLLGTGSKAVKEDKFEKALADY